MNPKAKKIMAFLEYCPGGSLEGVLKRTAKRYNNGKGKAPVRDRTLWLIFDCLFQMILALRYPPKRWQPEYSKDDVDQALWERIPTAQDMAWTPPTRTRGQKAALDRGDLHRDRDRERGRSWVHFDIDPSNVLVKSLEPDGDLRHQLVPGMKLSDFSRCTDINELSSNPLQIWTSIWWGKNAWQTPEQFTTEWDWVELLPHGARVAGQYSWKTNLWGMGLIMWCLITHCVPPYGPLPEAFSEPNMPDRWSYGVYILNDDIPRFGSVDKDLRKLVMRCLMDDPAHRPSMAEISQAIKAKLDPPGPWPASGPNSDNDMRHRSRLGARQLREMFVNPPVSDHSGHDLAQWLEGNLDIIGDA
ncbi:kinase-like domain-containing protein [Lasiosphaeris hirsuta]|uniref:Kinase-like domain-containing protein n=1 Tax=Lasiosphaeris hirsuta TaxID=260670 RepID=A0AA40E2W8_9PEZI|nr:kinase-like domain-containing protein [Lasiosphaeris hirsuta]